MKYIAIALAAVALTGCSDASKAQWQAKVDLMADKVGQVKDAARWYCGYRAANVTDDMALAAIALATNERFADIIKGAVDKVCEWAPPVATEQPKAQQAEVVIPDDLLRSLPFPLPRVK